MGEVPVNVPARDRHLGEVPVNVPTANAFLCAGYSETGRLYRYHWRAP